MKHSGQARLGQVGQGQALMGLSRRSGEVNMMDDLSRKIHPNQALLPNQHARLHSGGVSRGPAVLLRCVALLALVFGTGLVQTGCADGCGQGAPPDDPDLVQLQPEVLAPSDVDWGEINLLTTVTKEVVIQNVGEAKLTLSNVALAIGDSGGTGKNKFTIVAAPDAVVAAGESTRMRIRAEGYQVDPDPNVKTTVIDTLIIESDDPTFPRIEVPLQAAVVKPVLSFFPPTLDYNNVPTGSSQTQTVTLQNSGKGTLALYELNFLGDTSGELSYALPPDFQLGQTLSAGRGISVSVTYTPVDDTIDNVTLEIVSSDPDDSRQEIAITGNGKENKPPQVTFITPVVGDTFYTGSTVEVVGKVVDDIDSPESMRIFLFSNVEGSFCPDVKANSDGIFTCQVTVTQPGDQIFNLLAVDPLGKTSETATVQIIVWDLETPLSYVISGSSDTSLYAFTPDDNMQVFVIDRDDPNKSTLCVNAVDDIREPESPRSCAAKYGDKLRIVVYDRYGSGFGVPKLHLWYGRNDEYDQVLIEEPISLARGQEGYVETNPECLPSPTREEWYATHAEDDPPPDCPVYDELVEVVIPEPVISTPE